VKRVLAWVVALLLLGGGSAWLYVRLLPPPPLPPPPGEIERLAALQEMLGEQFKTLVVEGGEKSIERAPRGDIMIGLPTSLTRGIAEKVTTGLFGETTVRLQNLKVHKEGEVKVKMIFAKRKVGEFVLDATILEARALVRPGKPTLTFKERSIGIGLPFDLADGGGKVALKFAWDSKGLAANMVCGDLDVTKVVTGTVVPQRYAVRGSFAIAIQGSSLKLTPDFPELAVRIFAQPTEQAWAVVDEVKADQRAGCRKALDKIDIKKILGNILGKGFNIKIPPKVLRPVNLPAGLEQSLSVQGVKVNLGVQTTDLVVSEERLWYGANVTAEVGERPPGVAGSGAER
jgi:hypothetical protein